MKAILYTKYGSPDVLQLKEIATPAPKDNEVLIKILASTVTAADVMMRRGKPIIVRFMVGLAKPKNPRLGYEFAGEVVSVGKNVKLFNKGDQVFGEAGENQGAYAEYVCVPENAVMAIKPSNMSYKEAAVIVDGALTALHFIRDKGKVQRGSRVLINGASGSVGTAAVQLAKYYGAEVTGVCSSANIEMVKSLGADKVIDYTKDDFAATGQHYDVIFDTVSKSSFSHCRNSLVRDGIYLATIATIPLLIQSLWTSVIGSRRAAFAAAGMRPAAIKTQDLMLIKELIEAGHLKSVIEKCYTLEQIGDAHRHVEKGHKKGNVAITM